MDKSKQKRNKYNELVVNELSTKHGFSTYYIRACIRGDRNSLTSDRIRKEYKELTVKVNSAINQAFKD